ncbi:bifunctional helix-turn-helix transcriptional regulator/GNAT family N-acetyltransferase [Pseudooceanicola onchidii]|uniref:bifunctional helix-turn-helix transcriptional regulator/GNAT family N-acetyltransferase n=1 Tax=Pseudooceanicola onchidii TaxID=2562279 RepID=UPI0010AAC578|nr:helix-turn-helix domain-containing GNAT family N-acetyltransferase [Pseudooceanicola onchidii]
MYASLDQVEAVRQFNRFYTAFVGALSDRFLGTDYGLTPMRVLYQIGIAGEAAPTAAEIARAVGLDKAQVSRAVADLEKGGLLDRRPDPDHAKRLRLFLTGKGHALYLDNVQAQQDQIGAYLDTLRDGERERLVEVLTEAERLLSDRGAPEITLRRIRPGDMGWVIAQQTRLYVREYGWNGDYETLVLKILSDFAARQPALRETGWLAEVDGQPAGAVFVMEKTPEIAQLRLLHVEAHARGLGLGGKLVDQCLTFSTAVGYRRIELWTNDVLTAARKIYQSRGFELMEESHHMSFGANLKGQTWGRDL